MIEIDKKMSQKNRTVNLNVDIFMRNLSYAIETSSTNRQIFFTSSLMVSIIPLLSITLFGAQNLEFDSYLMIRTENLLETDFWNVKTDYLEYEQNYFNNMTYFLLDEGYIWEAVELLNQFELIKEESS